MKVIRIKCPKCKKKLNVREKLKLDVVGWQSVPEKIFQKKCTKCGCYFRFKYIKGKMDEPDRVEVFKRYGKKRNKV